MGSKKKVKARKVFYFPKSDIIYEVTFSSRTIKAFGILYLDGMTAKFRATWKPDFPLESIGWIFICDL